MSEHATNDHRRAAWAAFTDADVDWLVRRDAVASEWIFNRSREEAQRPIVRVDTDAGHWRRDEGPVGKLVRAGSVITNRSGTGRGPTMAFNPTERCMAGALACAQGYSIVAVEHPTLPLYGWAASVGAVDLRTGEVLPDPLTEQQRDRITRIVDQAYNGWKAARRFVQRPMAELAESGISWWEFVGAILAIAPRRAELDALRQVAPQVWQREDEAWRRRVTRL